MLLRDFILQLKTQIQPEKQGDLYWLLSDMFLKEKYQLLTDTTTQLVEEDRIKFLALWTRYLQGEPLQYLLGYTYFYGLKLRVNREVLIPRGDSEVLVEALLKESLPTSVTLIDLGAGSGNLALAIKKQRPQWMVVALDDHLPAVTLAKQNAQDHHLSVHFVCEDMFKHLDKYHYEVIVSNPPYIAKGDEAIDLMVDRYEPHHALYAEEQGLYYYRRLLEHARRRSTLLFLEVGYQQMDTILAMADGLDTTIYKDISGHRRVLRVKT
jgi:release factor glutamine methyltransferase